MRGWASPKPLKGERKGVSRGKIAELAIADC
jgi:hypothetical protein